MNRVVLLAVALLCCACAPEDPAPVPCTPPEDPVGTLDVMGAQWVFRDISVRLGFQDREGMTEGIGVADIDGDGDLDVHVSHDNRPARLLVNQLIESGSLEFEPHPSPPSVEVPWASSFADYDNDGDQDVFLACGGYYVACSDALFRNDGVDSQTGEVIFTEVTDQAGMAEYSYRSFQGHWVDFDRDGLLDLFVSVRIPLSMWGSGPELEVPTQDRLFRNLGGDQFEDVSVDVGLDATTDSGTAAWADFNGDGWLDVFVPALMSGNILYLSEAGESFTQSSVGFAVPMLTMGAHAGDFDHDGDFDILVPEYFQPWVRDGGFLEYGPALHLNDGMGSFTESAAASGLALAAEGGMGVLGHHVGDLDLDGNEEHFFGTGGPYLGGGETNGVFTRSYTSESGMSWENRSAPFDLPAVVDCDETPPESTYPFRTHTVVLADMDMDSDLDVLLGNGGKEWDNYESYPYEPNRFWLNESEHKNSSLWIDLEGTQSNRDGIGAVVTITDASDSGEAGWRRTAMVSTTGGFVTSTPAVLAFGLGERSGPFEVHVLWPLGVEQTVEGVSAGEHLTLVEPE